MVASSGEQHTDTVGLQPEHGNSDRCSSVAERPAALRVVRFFANSSIQRKLLLSLSCLVVIPLLVLGLSSYRSSSRVISRKTTELYRQTLSQIARNYKINFDEIENTSLFLLAHDDVREMLNATRSGPTFFYARGRVDLVVTNHLIKPHIASLAVSAIDTSICYQAGIPVTSEDVNQWYRMAVAARGSPVWSDVHSIANVPSDTTTKVVSLYRQVIDLYKNVPIGMIRISMGQDTTQGNLIVGGDTETYLVDRRGSIFSRTGTDSLGDPVSDGRILSALQDDDEFLIRSIGGNRYAFINRVPGYDYAVVRVVPGRSLFYDTYLMRNLILYMLTGCLAFGLVVGYILTSNITKPIKVLTAKMNEVENGNLDVSVDTCAKDEMGQLSFHFNSMVLKIRTLIRDLYEVRLREREAELKALQQQINPHFLYNTLDTIRWTARRNGDHESSEYIEILSELLRQNLESGGNYTSLGSEVANLRNYVFLQQKRYGDRLTVEINIDETLYRYRTIRLVLQPLVENSINHGIAAIMEPGVITVAGACREDTILLTVTDNGRGVDDGVINEIINCKSETKRVYALKNINERIKYHFGERYGVRIRSNLDEGTEVSVTMPAVVFEAGA